MSSECLSTVRCFGGEQHRFKHRSRALNCDMNYAVYLPPQAAERSVPVVYYLSGLTCTDENFVTKAGAQRAAAELGVAIVAPDTSPRGNGVPDDPEGNYDMGLGAGFYLNATQAPWSDHYQMYDYVVTELPQVVADACPQVDTSRAAIMGHSMGGHGALTIGLKNPDRYTSFSAFSPIVAPTQCPWGKKAFTHYLGADESTWAEYDTCVLLSQAKEQRPILIDQGAADNFLEEQLKTHLIEEASEATGYPIEVRLQEGYDHSYYFIASFIESHLAFHARHLGAT
ncbi:MAG: S-formylglutathione hydrolase [Halieaceae bacterium]|nr:S-formylglutathione hydrolase [Halieaceae bacterium]